MEENEQSRRSALIVASLTAFLTAFMGSAINLALPEIQREFHIDAVVLTWLPSSYLLSAAVCLVPFGRLADIYGRKKVFGTGIVVFTVTSILTPLSITVPMLIASRCFQGVGGAMIFSTGIAILTSVYPPQDRGRVLGINVAAVYIGLSAGPFLGGFLTQHFGWRSIFYFTIPLGLVVIWLVQWKLKGEWADAKGEAFDVVGALLYGVSIVTVMYGVSLLPKITSAAVVLLGLLGLAAFVRMGAQSEIPRVRYLAFHRQPCLFAFVRGRTHPLRRHLRRRVFHEPLSSKTSRDCPLREPAWCSSRNPS